MWWTAAGEDPLHVTLPAALALAAGLAAIGRACRWLTAGGAVGAAVIGTAVFTGAGLRGAGLLALFFVSGSALTARSVRAGRSADGAAGAGRRAAQVAANGLVPAIAASLIGIGWPFGWAALVGALAAAQSDTWATEIGARSRHAPRLITTGRPVRAGTSGGVTWLGTVAGAAGSASMAGLAGLVGVPLTTAAAAALAGAAGMLVDSLLGATLQSVYYCPTCERETEDAGRHRGHGVTRRRGIPFIDNDGVNLLASVTGGVGAVLLARLL